jgi:hypothetical protein
MPLPVIVLLSWVIVAVQDQRSPVETNNALRLT